MLALQAKYLGPRNRHSEIHQRLQTRMLAEMLKAGIRNGKAAIESLFRMDPSRLPSRDWRPRAIYPTRVDAADAGAEAVSFGSLGR